MHDIVTKKTEKKFYNKYLYKVTLRCRGARIFKVLNPLEIIDKDESTILSSYYPWRNYYSYEKMLLLDIAAVLQNYPDEYSTRVESVILDIYTNSRELYEQLSAKFPMKITHRFEPDSESLEILDEKNTLAVKKLPHGKYEYKVFLKPHTLPNTDEKIRLLEYLDTLKPSITLSDAVKSWFKYTMTNWDRRYILVDNEKTLMLLKLRQGSVFGQVYKYVVVDK